MAISWRWQGWRDRGWRGHLKLDIRAVRGRRAQLLLPRVWAIIGIFVMGRGASRWAMVVSRVVLLLLLFLAEATEQDSNDRDGKHCSNTNSAV